MTKEEIVTRLKAVKTRSIYDRDTIIATLKYLEEEDG